jgi:rubrerythrin
MTVITPTKEDGAKTVPTAMTEVAPEQTMNPAELEMFAAGSGMNGQFLADTLSAFLAHEQCGVHVYRVVAGASQNPILKGKYEKFLGQTERHVNVLERLISSLGGNPYYVSPTARMVHSMNTGMMQGVVLAAGSADPLTRELVMLEAVLLAETKDHADWAFLAHLADEVPEGDARSALLAAVGEVEPEEDEHVDWAQDTWQKMSSLQAKSTVAMKIADFTERTMATVKNAIGGSSA